MKDTILMISPILTLIISAITVVIGLSIRGEDNFQKTLDLLNAHTDYRDDDRVINTFTKEVVLRQIIRRQIARAYKPFSILSFTWLMIKLLTLLSLSLICLLLALSPSVLIESEMPVWSRAIFGALSLTLTISSPYIIMRISSTKSVIIGDNLERMIYVHYLTELGFKQKAPSHKFKVTKCKFAWINAMIHAIKVGIQLINKLRKSIMQHANNFLDPFFSTHEASRLYAQLIKTETQLKTLNHLKQVPTDNPLHHSWREDKITQIEAEIQDLIQELTDKWPNEYDALKDWTAYAKGFSNDIGGPIHTASDRPHDTETKSPVNSEQNQK